MQHGHGCYTHCSREATILRGIPKKIFALQAALYQVPASRIFFPADCTNYTLCTSFCARLPYLALHAGRPEQSGTAGVLAA
ncbi:MAG: hypothetical protein ACLGP3_05895, partial [Acidobacteriota bacterium]